MASSSAGHRGRIGRQPPGPDVERGAHTGHQSAVHHRLPAPGRLRAREERAPPVELIPRAEERVVQASLEGQQVHEPQVQPVHRDRLRQRRQVLQPAHGAEPPARVPRLLEHGERQAARGAQVPAPLLGNPREEIRLPEYRHAPKLEDPLEVFEGDGGIELRGVPRRRDARVHDAKLLPVLRAKIPRLRHRRDRDRRQVRHQLGVIDAHRLDHHRIGGPDQRAPPLVTPQTQVLRRHEFIADDTAMHRAEPGRVAGVDHLLRRGREEMRRRFRTQDQDAIPARRDRQRPTDFPARVDGLMRAGGQTESARDAGLIHDLHLRRRRPRPPRWGRRARRPGRPRRLRSRSKRSQAHPRPERASLRQYWHGPENCQEVTPRKYQETNHLAESIRLDFPVQCPLPDPQDLRGLPSVAAVLLEGRLDGPLLHLSHCHARPVQDGPEVLPGGSPRPDRPSAAGPRYR